MPVHSLKLDLRIIVSCHGESLHNVAGEKISYLWGKKLLHVRNRILKDFGNNTQTNILIDECLSRYETKKETITYNLLEKVDYLAYRNPILTERGKFQTNYYGAVLKDYLSNKNLSIAKFAFSSPFERTLSSIKQILGNFKNTRIKILAVPDLIEPFGRFVDKFSTNEIQESFTILNDGINADLVMYASESDKQVAKRIKRGFEKIFKYLQDYKETGVPVIMTQGGIMRIISANYFESRIEDIENPTLWDLHLQFDQNGNLLSIKLLEKLSLTSQQQLEFKKLQYKIKPSDTFLAHHDFTVVDEALSWLAKEAREEIANLLSGKLSKTSYFNQNTSSISSNYGHLKALAQNPYISNKYVSKKPDSFKLSHQNQLTKRKLTTTLKIEPVIISGFLKSISPLEMIVLSLFNKGMTISNIKDLLFEVYGYKISKFSISIIINRLQDDALSNTII